MGLTITATNSSYDFDMGYGGFYNLRKSIAHALDEDFGDNYANIAYCHTKKDFKENDEIAEWLIETKNLDKDVVDFLYMPDSEGEIPYQTCKKILNLIRDIDFEDKGFRYAAYQHNDYEEFKKFLQECYSKRRKMRWR